MIKRDGQIVLLCICSYFAPVQQQLYVFNSLGVNDDYNQTPKCYILWQENIIQHCAVI